MHSLFLLAIIWIAVYLSTIMARWTKLTPVLWYLFFGAAMASLGILPQHPDPFIAGLAELGIIVIMFSIGFEENTNGFVESIKKSWGIAFFGGLFPFVTAYLVADYFWNNVNIALMCGLAMTATAVSLTMVSLRAEGLGQSEVATRIMTSALLDDIASLALVAILVPIASGAGPVSVGGLAVIALKAIAFFLIVTILGMWVFPHNPKGWVKKIPWLGHTGIRNMLKFGDGEHITLTMLLLAVLIGLLAYQFGFHPAVGAFMAGLILRQEFFAFDEKPYLFDETGKTIDNIAFSWLGPIFFVALGAHIVFDYDMLVSVIPQVALMTTALFVMQTLSASTAARYTGGMTWPASMMIGFGMLGRAELAFVVMDIAYVQNKIIPTDAFYTLMITAFFLNIAVPVTIKLWKPVYERDLAQSNLNNIATNEHKA